MIENSAKRVKIVSKPSLNNTLKSLPLGEPYKFQCTDFKTQSARIAVSGLRKKGYQFKLTEEGMVNEYVVTRLK